MQPLLHAGSPGLQKTQPLLHFEATGLQKMLGVPGLSNMQALLHFLGPGEPQNATPNACWGPGALKQMQPLMHIGALGPHKCNPSHSHPESAGPRSCGATQQTLNGILLYVDQGAVHQKPASLRCCGDPPNPK